MEVLEILLIILAPSYVLFIIGRYIYKRMKHLPTDECANCKLLKASKELKKFYENNK